MTEELLSRSACLCKTLVFLPSLHACGMQDDCLQLAVLLSYSRYLFNFVQLYSMALHKSCCLTND